MKITNELMHYFSSITEEEIELFNKFYPEGAESLEVIHNKDVPLSMCHWVNKYFSLSVEEIKEYERRCGIDESSSLCWNSDNVKNSRVVAESHNIENSDHIYTSQDIEKSSFVYNASNVINSNEIYYGNDIKRSSYVAYSNNIHYSYNIQSSQIVEWSNNIIFSTNIKNSRYVYKSDNCDKCFCSVLLSNCKHCLFCYGLNGAEYYIFNEPVEREVYEEWQDLLEQWLDKDNQPIMKIDDDILKRQNRYEINNHLGAVFANLPQEFYNWVTTVINYDAWKASVLFLGLYKFEKE